MYYVRKELLQALSIPLPSLPTQYRSERILRVGTAAAHAPFVSINAHGTYEGFDIDVIQHVADLLDYRIELIDCGSMTPLIISLQQQKVDCIIWDISITPQRAQYITFVPYQGTPTTYYVLLFWQRLARTITSIDDTRGLTICVEQGSVQDTFLSKYKDRITIQYVEKIEIGLLMIQQGKADALLVEPAIATNYTDRYPKDIITCSIPLPPEEISAGAGIGVHPTSSLLATEIATAVNTLKTEGTLALLEQKWGLT
jgi:polar amino acid transport system substrate-binding protein